MTQSTAALDVLSSGYQAHPEQTLKAMYDAGPVVPVRYPFLGNIKMVTHHGAIKELLQDRKTFVRDPQTIGPDQKGVIPKWFPRTFKVMATGMILRDEPDHRRLRRLVEQAFARQQLESLRTRVSEIADDLLNQMREQAQTIGQPVNIVHGFCRPLPLAVICEMMGLPKDDRGKFTTWAERFAMEPSVWNFLLLTPTLFSIERYLRKMIQKYRTDPLPGLLADLVKAESDGERLSEDELVAMSLLLLFAGHMTTTHAIGNMIYELAGHPEQREAVIQGTADNDLLIDEVLRYSSPVQFTKPMIVAHDVEWHGTSLKQGEKVIAFLASGNRDPNVFTNPNDFDLTRDPNPHLAFGSGIHYCLGAKLATLEMEVAIEKLYRSGHDYRVATPLAEVKWSRQKGIRGPETLLVTPE